MRILITGADGFVGSHLADTLANEGHKITLFDLKFGKNTKHMKHRKIIGDVSNYSDTRKVVEGKDVVFHFAALSRVVWGEKDPLKCYKYNVIGVQNIAHSAWKSRSKPIIISASSREVYGEPIRLPVTEDCPKNPISVYGRTKVMGEETLKLYSEKFGVRSIIFRFSNIYGSKRDQLDRVVPKFMLLASKDHPITLNGGNQILDFTYIGDVVDGLYKAFEKREDIVGEDFLLANGKGTSIKQLARKIIKIYGSKSELKILPEKSFDVKKFIGSYEKANKMFGYRPKIDLDKGLKILDVELRGEKS